MPDPIERARLMKQIMQMRDDLAGKLGVADATIADLRAVANTAGNAITTSQIDRAALHQQLDGLAAVMPAFGTASTPALSALGTTVDVTIALNRSMPSATYKVAFIPAVAIMGKIDATVKTKTATTVTVTLKSLGTGVAASTINVTAWP